MMHKQAPESTLVWWGRGDPDYSRNSIVRAAMRELGWSIHDYRPSKAVSLGLLPPRGLPEATRLVWVPCFRQRDVAGAARWARGRGIPLVFDPLISAYDKQVFEKGKFSADSARGRRLLAWESGRMAMADRVVADTQAHADYFVRTLGVSAERTAVIPVGADETLFKPIPLREVTGSRLRVLFYGSFIALQGPQTIVQAARLCPQADWCLLGEGPLRDRCQDMAAGLDHVRFEPWIDYKSLPGRIADADILLGVFSGSDKAGRVVPNKVYQAIATGRPVITRRPLPGVSSWPCETPDDEPTGVIHVPHDDPQALAQAVAELCREPDRLAVLADAAASTFKRYASAGVVRAALGRLLDPYRAPIRTTS